MAAGDLLQKRSGSFGVAYESTPGTAEASPIYYLTSADANLPVEPRTYERVNNIGAEIIGMQQAKYNLPLSVSNAELSIEEAGYLLWLMLGAEDNSTPGTHIITPQFESHYATFFKDYGGDFASSVQVQRLVKGRLSSFSLEQDMDAFAKVSLQGQGCNLSNLASGFSPSLDLAATASPISWGSLTNVQVGWNGGSVAASDYVKKFSISVERELTPAAYKISTKLPDHIAQGKRTVKFSFSLDLEDADTDAAGAWAAINNGQDVELNAIWTTGTHVLSIAINQARITGNPFGPVGAGADAQELTVEATAFQNDTDLPISVAATDGNTTDYDAR